MSTLQVIKSKASVIFTTAYPEFAVEGFELNAVDYLMKPIAFERFFQAVEKVKAKMGGKQEENAEADHIMLKADKKMYRTSSMIFYSAKHLETM